MCVSAAQQSPLVSSQHSTAKPHPLTHTPQHTGAQLPQSLTMQFQQRDDAALAVCVPVKVASVMSAVPATAALMDDCVEVRPADTEEGPVPGLNCSSLRPAAAAPAPDWPFSVVVFGAAAAGCAFERSGLSTWLMPWMIICSTRARAVQAGERLRHHSVVIDACPCKCCCTTEPLSTLQPCSWCLCGDRASAS